MNENNTIIVGKIGEIRDLLDSLRSEDADKIVEAAFDKMSKIKRPLWPWIDEDKAAELLCVKVKTLREKRETHQLRHSCPGKKIHYHIDDLNAYFENAAKIDI